MFSVFTEMGRADVIFFFPAQLVVVIVVQKNGISMWHQISGIILFINCKCLLFMGKNPGRIWCANSQLQSITVFSDYSPQLFVTAHWYYHFNSGWDEAKSHNSRHACSLICSLCVLLQQLLIIRKYNTKIVFVFLVWQQSSQLRCTIQLPWEIGAWGILFHMHVR